MFRLLKENEIECKIANIKENGLSLLLYKTARTDMDLLDETVEPTNWDCDYKEIKGNMYCGISIYDTGKKEWITKWDCGVESAFGDKEKGEASDAFKRAGFKWGIGRELYTSPFIWITNTNCKIDSKKCYDKFEVVKIGYNENREINELQIKNITLSKIVFDMKKPIDNTLVQDLPEEDNKVVNETQETALRDFIANNKIANDFVINTLTDFGYGKLSEIQMKDYKKFQETLEKALGG